ncbi:hypothetical protein BH23GEM8_BH23GEM8_07860 [soil metagenome]
MDETVDEAHRPLLSHLHAFLKHREACRESGDITPTSPSFFLLRDDQETFWELVGFRLQGCHATLLGAFRFRRQPADSNPYARRPLSYFLSQPPKDIGVSAGARPAWLIEVLLPQPGEDIPAFRQRVREDRAVQIAFMDANLLEFAFDFRVQNPSAERERGAQSSLPRSHLFRTVHGHILYGSSHGLHARLLQTGLFITFHNGRQYTPTGSFALPTLSVHRSMVTMDAHIAINEDVAGWLDASIPFDRATAEATHLLMPGTPGRDR